MPWLVIRACFDEATEYSFQWSQEIVDLMKENGIEFLDLPKGDAVREKVETILGEYPEMMVIHYDHGNEDCIWGQDEKVIDLDNNKLLKNRECYSMSCLSAKILGADSYRRYATIYWGSWEIISFTTDALEEFQRAMNFGIKMRLNGETDWNKIMDKTIEHDNQVINELINKGKIFAAALLLEDSNARRVWTDKTPPPPEDSQCTFRKIALFLLGQRGWRINPFK